MEKFALGLMDFGYRNHKMNSMYCIEDVISYAVHADNLGFSRLWLTEHHISSKSHAWTDPTVLLPIIALSTEKISLGVAGNLLRIHEPYSVLTNYKLLTNLFPNRIDLGLANSGVTPEVAKLATGSLDSNLPTCFAQKLEKLFDLINSEDHIFESGTVFPPYHGMQPSIWSLTTSMGTSLDRALKYGTNLSRSIFHNGADKEPHKQKLNEFRDEFFIKHGRYPKVNLVVSGCCHETDAKADKAVGEKLEAHQYTIIGSKDRVFDDLMKIGEDYGVDELIFMNVARNPKDRLVGLQLISDAFNLNELQIKHKKVA